MTMSIPLDLSHAFSRFRNANRERIHFAAHSHHFWPDVTEAAHVSAWATAARLVDDKWDHVLGEVWPAVRAHIARHLKLPDPTTLVPATNTHEFVNRLLSCGPANRPMRVVATDGEFHSFMRQTERLAEDGVIALTLVPTEPFASFPQRFVEAVKTQQPDLAFFSQVFFNSGFAIVDLKSIVDAIAAPDRLVVIDGYHGFMARPTDLSRIADRAFYLAGGYKYAMSGEGACFMHCPPGFALRPRNTGWYASFGHLASEQTGVSFAADGWRFMGATFDPSGLFRMRAVFDWLAAENIDAATVHAHVTSLQLRFMNAMEEKSSGPFTAANLVVPLEGSARGNFLAFDHKDAAGWYRRLHNAGIVTDVRGTRLRVGFGLYHNADDVDRLVSRLRTLPD